MNKYTSFFLVFLLLTSVLVGCESSDSISTREYVTAPQHLMQNTEKARKLNVQAVLLIEESQYAEAEALLRKALTADVMYGPAHNSMGKLHFEIKHFYQAAWEFQYAIKLMPDRPEPKNNLGLVYEAVGRLSEAIENYEQALSLAPDRPEMIGNLARAHLRNGDRNLQVRRLLTDLVLRETRPEWATWAQSTLAQLGGPPDASESHPSDGFTPNTFPLLDSKPNQEFINQDDTHNEDEPVVLRR